MRSQVSPAMTRSTTAYSSLLEKAWCCAPSRCWGSEYHRYSENTDVVDLANNPVSAQNDCTSCHIPPLGCQIWPHSTRNILLSFSLSRRVLFVYLSFLSLHPQTFSKTNFHSHTKKPWELTPEYDFKCALIYQTTQIWIWLMLIITITNITISQFTSPLSVSSLYHLFHVPPSKKDCRVEQIVGCT